MEEKCGELNLEVRRKEGYSDGRWIVLDFAHILVHIFTQMSANIIIWSDYGLMSLNRILIILSCTTLRSEFYSIN